MIKAKEKSEPKIVPKEQHEQRETLKERAGNVAKVLRLSLNAWDKTRRMLMVLAFYTVTAVQIVAGYSLIVQNDIYYNRDEYPIAGLYDSLKIQDTPKENLQMVEYINKDTKILKAEFKTVKQTGDVEVNYVLLNGLTDRGYWYQGGVATTHGNNIFLIYDVFNSKGISISGGRLIEFNKKVNLGDTFTLEVSIKNDNVSVNSIDMNNGADAKKELKAVGSTFIASNRYNKIGFSTSIFREMWASSSFDTRGITPQTIELIYPKLETANLFVKKRIYAKIIYKDNPRPKPQIFTIFDFGSINLHTNPKYLIPKSADPSFNNIRVAASGNIFYTEGR